MNARKLVLDSAICITAFCGILEILRIRGTAVPLSFFWVALLVALFVAFSMQKFKIRGSAEGGWFFVFVLASGSYVIAARPTSLTPHDVEVALSLRLSQSYPMLVSDAVRFRDIYTILLSAAFTLYAIFFIVVRKIDLLSAVRLVTIADGFAGVFLVGLPALFFPNEGWWRLGMMAGLSLTALAALARDPRPYIVSYSVDSAVTVTFWESYLRIRRGWAIFGLVGLALMPLYPVLGETLFALTLLYVLYVTARGASFLYISTQLPAHVTFASALASLFQIVPSAETKAMLERLQGTTGRRYSDNQVTVVPFVVGQPPPPPKEQPRGRA